MVVTLLVELWILEAPAGCRFSDCKVGCVSSVSTSCGDPGCDVYTLYQAELLTTFLNLSVGLLYRPVNVGFSGGEARVFELIQMVALEPKLCVLDETDSGLDRERAQCYASLVLAFAESSRAVLVITHSVSVVSMLAPDSVYYLTDAGFVNIRSALYIV
ncbi:FeS assembly ATPase SufC [Candidatus Hodgkinia cicadicola]|nr:FeS assembly ATPase SufC [Candidatus Hodgkinia cicadicola]